MNNKLFNKFKSFILYMIVFCINRCAYEKYTLSVNQLFEIGYQVFKAKTYFSVFKSILTRGTIMFVFTVLYETLGRFLAGLLVSAVLCTIMGMLIGYLFL